MQFTSVDWMPICPASDRGWASPGSAIVRVAVPSRSISLSATWVPPTFAMYASALACNMLIWSVVKPAARPCSVKLDSLAVAGAVARAAANTAARPVITKILTADLIVLLCRIANAWAWRASSRSLGSVENIRRRPNIVIPTKCPNPQAVSEGLVTTVNHAIGFRRGCRRRGGEMLRIQFTTEDVAHTRIAPRADPLWELVLAVHMLRRQPGDELFTSC